MSLSPNTTLAHYTILSKIRAGGMGEVYRARDTRLDREIVYPDFPLVTSGFCWSYYYEGRNTSEEYRHL